MPAPRCWVRLPETWRRRVGRVELRRAEPIGVLESFVEIPELRTLVDLLVALDPLALVGPEPTARAGAPQTLQ